MKFFIKATIFIILLLFTVSSFLPKKEKQQFSDKELREVALSRNMSSTPATYEDLLKLVDTPQNRLTKDKIDLGRDLYYDKILSKNKDISCATCHILSKNQNNKSEFLELLTSKTNNKTDCVVCHLHDQSATDRLETAVGHNGVKNQFHLNTLTTLNSALAKYQTWDGSINTPEEQVGASIQDPYQMNLLAAEAQKRLLENEEYVKKFNLSYGSVSFEM